MFGAMALLALGGLFLWLVRGKSPRPAAPEDDRTTALDQDELTAAERELLEDPEARSLGERADREDEDDWGPGVAR